MTLDPVSFALGIVATFVFSALIVVGELFVDWRQAKKEQDRALNQSLAEVGVACIEQPTNVRSN